MATDRKEDILDAFMKLVSRFGLDKTTMQDVAKEAGISVGVIYKDFKNKEDLIDAYINRLDKDFACSCESLIEEDLPAEELLRNFITGVFRTIFMYISQDRGFLQCISSEEALKYMRYGFKRRHPFMMEIKTIIARIMEQGIREGAFEIDDVPKTAELFLNGFNSYGKMFFLEQDSEQVLSKIEDMYSFLVKAIKKHAV
jgi:AcrR family transcriptional regulator